MSATCGAKTRSGGTCKKAPLHEKKHCKWHDAPERAVHPNARPGNANAWRHGMYGDLIRPDDLPFVEEIRSKVGAIEDELLIARLQLRRALRAQAGADALPDGLEVAETVERDGAERAAGRNEVKRKLRDYSAVINTLLGRIESLEKTRLDLLKADKVLSGSDGGFVFTVHRVGSDGV